jgi:arylsulfatase A-like enzyme
VSELGPNRGFQGRIGTTIAESEAWWPPRPTAPEGAPNVVIVLCDDVGFADLGCFGGEIDTPNLDRLAAEAVRLTNFHVAPMCSPTRAALLTGLNHHLAGVATVAHSDPGFPNLECELTPHASTMAEILRDNGYATLMVGKWHLAKDNDCHDAGSKHSWPSQRGFDSFYGILDPFTNFHHPHRLVRDNTAVAVDRYPDDYYFTDDLTSEAISMVRSVKAADPTKPFFLYFAHGAAHAPLQAKAVDIDKYADRYRVGWDAVREERYRRQLEMGVIPSNAVLPPRNSEPRNEVKAWDELTEREQELFARYMAVYAAMVDNIDQNFGRLRTALEEMGEWENTLVLFTSDNGGSREGESNGTSQYFRTLLGTSTSGHGGAEDPGFEADWSRRDLMGSPQTLPHYPRGWAMVSSTPFRLYKINTHLGGHSVPCIVSWPARLGTQGSMRRQFAHVTDVLPTVLDVIGIERPTHRNGEPVFPLAGASMATMLADPDAPPHHREQYQELHGHRGYYRDGWHLVTLHQPRTRFGDHEWELYDLRNDPTETTDVAAQHPDLVAELAVAWEAAAQANQVYPLDEGTPLKHIQRPPREQVFSLPVTIHAGTSTLERYRASRLVHARDFGIVVDVDHRAGDEGILVAHGDQGGGYVVYVEGGNLHFTENAYGDMIDLAVPLAGAASRIDVAVHNPGKSRWVVTLSADGVVLGESDAFVALMAMAPFEGIDVGLDRRSPVSWDLYERHGTFPYTGALRSVRYEPGELAPDAGERWIEVVRQMGLKYE